MENLGCANCAAKIEKKIIELPGVEEAILTYSTKQLRLTAEDPDSYIEEIQRIARSFEPEITIKELDTYAEKNTVKIEDIVTVSDQSDYTLAFLVDNEMVKEITLLGENPEYTILAEDMYKNKITEKNKSPLFFKGLLEE